MSAVVVADRDGRYLDATEEALALYRVTLDQLRSMRIGDFSGPHAELARTVWHRLASTGSPIPTGESTIYFHGGAQVRVRYVRIQRRPDGAYELELAPVEADDGIDAPPVADHPSQVLQEWRAAERDAEAGDTDGAIDGVEGLRELYRHSLAGKARETSTR